MSKRRSIRAGRAFRGRCGAILAAVAAFSGCGCLFGGPAAAQSSPAPKVALPVVPAPGEPGKVEADFMARLDAALAPLKAYVLPANDGPRLKEAFKALGARAPERAIEIQREIEDPVARKLVDWGRLRAGLGTPQEARAFLDGNPVWPDRGGITQKAEEALFVAGGSSTEIKAFFGTKTPQTGPGLAALASAFLAEGNAEEAKRLAQRAWREEDFSAALEPGFLARFKDFLTAQDHKWRLDRLIIANLRWDDERSKRAAVARRVVPLLSIPEQKKANARIAQMSGARDAKKLLDALPPESAPDWGLVYHRVEALRAAGKVEDAAKLLLSAPTDEASIVAPDEWWVERRAVAYDALKANKPKLAYELVREAGPLSVNPLKDQTFMAGWLALRQLKDYAAAAQHFEALRKASDGPLSRAKAAYWLGRTAEARGDKAAADELYRAALRDPDTFHALLARQKIEPGRQEISLTPPALASDEQIQRFLSLDAAKAAVIVRQSGLDISIMRAFFVQLRMAAKTEAESALVAHFAEMLGDTQSAVRIAKMAIARGQNLIYYGYPVHTFPSYTPLRAPPEPAFLLGIARQETEFNTLTVSGAGAKGLLQVMTVTAKHVCQDYKIKCDIPRLLTDPSYNTTLASAYIGDRMGEFDGSYVLAIAGYNAGPGRARQWIREFGDPREAGVDPIDWIERIPIQETREYVGKVLANIQVYRARLGIKGALRLTEDLMRGRGGRSSSSGPASGRDG